MAKILLTARVEKKQFKIVEAYAEVEGYKTFSEAIRQIMEEIYSNSPEVQNKLMELEK